MCVTRMRCPDSVPATAPRARRAGPADGDRVAPICWPRHARPGAPEALAQARQVTPAGAAARTRGARARPAWRRFPRERIEKPRHSSALPSPHRRSRRHRGHGGRRTGAPRWSACLAAVQPGELGARRAVRCRRSSRRARPLDRESGVYATTPSVGREAPRHRSTSFGRRDAIRHLRCEASALGALPVARREHRRLSLRPCIRPSSTSARRASASRRGSRRAAITTYASKAPRTAGRPGRRSP